MKSRHDSSTSDPDLSNNHRRSRYLDALDLIYDGDAIFKLVNKEPAQLKSAEGPVNASAVEGPVQASAAGGPVHDSASNTDPSTSGVISDGTAGEEKICSLRSLGSIMGKPTSSFPLGSENPSQISSLHSNLEGYMSFSSQFMKYRFASDPSTAADNSLCIEL
jgi:hypothetical protein